MLRTALCVLVLAVAASAAPQYHDFDHHHHRHHPGFYQDFTAPHHHHHHDYDPSPAFGSDMFDTRRFWMDLSREMMSLDQMMQDFYRRFPMTVSTANYADGKYKITLPLSGFDEKEITVKAKDSFLMVQAIHKGDIQKTYIDARNLPEDVDVKGTWTYDGKALVIVFPVKQTPTTDEDKKEDENTSEQGSTETETANRNHDTVETESTNSKGSREEMDTNHRSESTDADVGLRPTHVSTESEDIETNVIPTQSPVDGTTYSVDFKDEVEFVPVKY